MPDATPSSRHLLTWFLLAAWCLLLIWHAWVTDDAFITLRTVDNALNGYGLRWNVVERVQVYTHPLWMFLTLAATWLIGSAYHAVLVLGIACSFAAVWVVVHRIARNTFEALLVVVFVSTSSAYLDYSTSGLENPFTHLALALFFVQWFTPDVGATRTFRLALLTALIMMNRLDAGLMVLPALAMAVWQRLDAPNVRAAALGLVPLAAWHTFSLVYYGFLFPNTAYAKLSTGVSSIALLVQGSYYLADSLRADSVTLVTVAAALALTVARSRRRLWPLACGIVLYLAYILRIGGDFMAGRFLAAPFLLSVIVLLHLPLPQGWRSRAAVLVAIVALRAGLAMSGIEDARAHGITDQRMYYSRDTRLITQRDAPLEERLGARRGIALRAGGRQVVEHGAVGMVGFFAGPEVHIIDRFALTDPLLARRPANPLSRIGHFQRRLPAGYIQTVRSGTNRLQSRRLAEFYDDLVLITQGPIWTRARWAAIVRLNLIRRTA